MKTYRLFSDRKYQILPGTDVERISKLLANLFRTASTLSPPVLLEAMRLDVHNHAREIEDDLS